MEKEVDTQALIAEFNENIKYWTNKKRKSQTGNDFMDFLVHKKLVR
jgi:predicted PolB exonuclease-like 3'-5' exonuclease